MSRPLSFKESLSVWRTMADNLAAHLDEMPQLRDLQQTLLALVDRGEAVLAESLVHEANLRTANREKRTLFGEGRELRNQIALGLQAAMGVHNDRLVEFGLSPRPRDVRRKRLTRAERARQAEEAAGTTPETAAKRLRKGDPRSVN
jgi:hypothetical protein